MTTLVTFVNDLTALGFGDPANKPDGEAAIATVKEHWNQINKCNDDLLNRTTMCGDVTLPNLVIVTDNDGIKDIASDAPDKIGTILILDQSDSEDNTNKPQVDITDYAAGAGTQWGQVTPLPEAVDFAEIMERMMQADLPADTTDGDELTIDAGDDE